MKAKSAERCRSSSGREVCRRKRLQLGARWRFIWKHLLVCSIDSAFSDPEDTTDVRTPWTASGCWRRNTARPWQPCKAPACMAVHIDLMVYAERRTTCSFTYPQEAGECSLK